jgi:hypothetical protein
MRIIQLVLLAALFAASHPTATAANSDRTNVHAILVIASNHRGESDRRLADYEPTLRRLLRFESYRLAGEGSSSLAVPGKASVALGRGHKLEIETEKSEGKGLRLRINWQDGSRSLMSTGLSLQPGVPAVLGGPSSGNEGEVWAVILVAN